MAGLTVGLVLVAIAAAFGFIGQQRANVERDRANVESTRAIEQEAAAEATSTAAIGQQMEAERQAGTLGWLCL